jgi:hypothetical protein
LLDTFKPLALNAGWRWAGADMSESACVNEAAMASRLILDLSIITSDIVFQSEQSHSLGFKREEKIINKNLTLETLSQIFQTTPGLIVDKLKTTLEIVWGCMQGKGIKGIIFSYDEAQNMSNNPQKEQFPLSILLDTFQSLQKKSIPFMLLLTGLTTLFPKLVDARTFAERMFRVITLTKLNERDSRDAITKPIEKEGCPVHLLESSIKLIIKESNGYPYFIQFICKEAYDIFVQQHKKEGQLKGVPIHEIIQKLDSDFFAGRWSKATDRQRDLLRIIANLPNANDEFTVFEIVESAKQFPHPFGGSQVNQMLVALANKGLVYKNRWGKYSFAVPLLGQFILRTTKKRESYFWDIAQIGDLT